MYFAVNNNNNCRKPSKEDHTRLDVSSNRAQKKRIEHLEKVLKSLKPEEANRSGIIDPQEVYGPQRDKTSFQGFRQSKFQSSLLSYRD